MNYGVLFTRPIYTRAQPNTLTYGLLGMKYYVHNRVVLHITEYRVSQDKGRQIYPLTITHAEIAPKQQDTRIRNRERALEVCMLTSDRVSPR